MAPARLQAFARGGPGRGRGWSGWREERVAEAAARGWGWLRPTARLICVTGHYVHVHASPHRQPEWVAPRAAA